jgi:putative transposase
LVLRAEKTVRTIVSKWSKKGVWETILDQLNQIRRKKAGRNANPSYAIIDAQSVKTQYASEERGIDGNKKVKGHKRHIVVDIMGCLLHVLVHAANLSDTKSACAVLQRAKEKYPSIKAFSGDAAYRGTAVFNMELHISQRIKDEWAILPKRWVVERTFAWLNNFRRLSKDFEILSSAKWVDLTNTE